MMSRRLIDADAFVERKRAFYCKDCDMRKNSKGKVVYEIGDVPCRACDIGDLLDAIESVQTVDAVSVVRCDECRWYDKSTASGTHEPIAYKCILHRRFTIGVQFCSDGERREDNSFD